MDWEQQIEATLAVLAGRATAAQKNQARYGARAYPLQVIPAVKPCRRVLYTTKLDWLMSLLGGDVDRLPRDIMVIRRYAPISTEHYHLLATILGRDAPELTFVGDLDPVDLLTYLSLLSKGIAWKERAPSTVASWRYLGIDDLWLDWCEADLASSPARGPEWAQIRIEMTEAEREHLETIKRLPADLSGIVGPKGQALLSSGYKLALEGASNPHIYSEGFRAQLLGRLFGVGPRGEE